MLIYKGESNTPKHQNIKVHKENGCEVQYVLVHPSEFSSAVKIWTSEYVFLVCRNRVFKFYINANEDISTF
jgi:hypothetical protein